ncbi:hypothetical protein [Spongiimicrobium sp. 3-5]|uniref:hypothetical protein n=1 Tax=Spongiimicrobium sp. 3-5 TaxID=3332596 RepID=UPI00397F6923
MRPHISSIWRFLGVLVTASSIISLIQRGYHVPLALSFADFVNYYRELVRPIFNILNVPVHWIFERFSWSIPPWLQDAQTLAFTATAIYVKAANAISTKGKPLRFPTLHSKFVVITFGGLTLLGLLWLLMIVFAMLIFPVYYINHLRWSPSLKWYDYMKVIRSIIIGSGHEVVMHHTLAIFGWLTTILVLAFYAINRMLI